MAIFVILALAFVPASFLVYLVQDRVSKSKHIQLISGLHPLIYWIGNYTWDMVSVLLLLLLLLLLGFIQNVFCHQCRFHFVCNTLLLLLFMEDNYFVCFCVFISFQ